MPLRPRYRLTGGMRMPLDFPPEGLESGLRYEPGNGDIFVASYPKCGTTWLQYIVWLLIRGRVLDPDEELTDVFPHLEEVGAQAVARLAEPRLIKTHLSFDLTPFADAARYLVIARNPFDCAVSFFHHTRGFPGHYDFADGEFADFFDCFIRGEVDFGDYFDHLTSWLTEASRENVKWLSYEDLKADPYLRIREIGRFLGIDSGSEGPDDAQIESVMRESSLESMRRDQQRWSSRRPEWAPEFVRQGIVGDWRTLFTPEMARMLLAKCDQRLNGTGIDRLWPGIAAEVRAFAGAERNAQSS